MFYRILLFSLLFTFSGNAFAQEAAPGSGAGSLIPLVLIFAIFYFLIIRPQQKKIKEHSQMVESLKRGDKVITSGGIEGLISKVDDSSGMLDVEIAKGVKVRVVKSTVSDVYARGAVSAKEEKAKKAA